MKSPHNHWVLSSSENKDSKTIMVFGSDISSKEPRPKGGALKIPKTIPTGKPDVLRADDTAALSAVGLPSSNESHPMDHDSNSSGHTICQA